MNNISTVLFVYTGDKSDEMWGFYKAIYIDLKQIYVVSYPPSLDLCVHENETLVKFGESYSGVNKNKTLN